MNIETTEEASEQDIKNILFQRIEKLKSAYTYSRVTDAAGTTYSAKMDRLSRRAKSVKQEAVLTARKIYDLSPAPLTLCLSSGIDSQLMLGAFLESGVRFEVAVMKFHHGFNDHDTISILDHCRSLGLKLSVVELDVIDFFESGRFLEYGMKYQCQSPQLAAHLWLLDQIGNVPILSGNFALPVMKNGRIFWTGLPGDLHGCMYRYFTANQRAGEPWFFLNSSELASAFLQLPSLARYKALQVTDVEIKDEYLVRRHAYQETGFPTVPQPQKTTGFEKVRAYYDERLGTTGGAAFNSLFRAPLERRNPFAGIHNQYFPSDILTGQVSFWKRAFTNA